jgi:hypothetical protein
MSRFVPSVFLANLCQRKILADTLSILLAVLANTCGAVSWYSDVIGLVFGLA